MDRKKISRYLSQMQKKQGLKRKKKLWSHKIFFQSGAFNHAITFFTVYTIFCDDLKRWFLDGRVDYIGDFITIAAFFGFGLEIICKLDLGKCAYVNSLPCFLDFASTLSLIMDQSLVSEDLMGGGQSGGPKFSRAGRASKVGTKIGRLVKIIRLLRVKPKCCDNDAAERERQRRAELKLRATIKKITDGKNSGDSGSITGDIGNKPPENFTTAIDPTALKNQILKDKNDGIGAWFEQNTIDLTPKEEVEEDDGFELPPELKIGTKLTTVTLKKIILIVLLLMMSTPMFSSTYYYQPIAAQMFDVIQWGSMVQSIGTSGNQIYDGYNVNSGFYL